MTRVEWTHTVETSRLLRVLTVAALGAIGSVFLLVGALLVFVVGTSLAAGEFAVLGLLLGASLLLGRRLIVSATLVRRGEGGILRLLSARELLAASVAWAVVIAILLALDAPDWVALSALLLAVFVLLPVVALLRSEGFVDTGAGVLDVDMSEASLAAVASVSRYELGPVTVLRIRYHGGTAGASAPRLFGVPSDTAAHIQTALEASDGEPQVSERNPLITRTLYGFGVALFGFVAVLGYYASQQRGDAVVLAAYAAVIAALFGALFVWLGYVES